MGNPWMPMYWQDYLQDTQHLTTLQHGAYCLIIAHYWTHGYIPGDDDAQMARITGLSMKGWLGNKAVIARFFLKGWKHKRIEAELLRTEKRIAQARAAGKRGGELSVLKRRGTEWEAASWHHQERKTQRKQESLSGRLNPQNQPAGQPTAQPSAQPTGQAETKQPVNYLQSKIDSTKPTPPVENVDNVDNPTGIPASEYKPVTGSLATALPSGALARRVETTRTADLLPENKFEPLPGRFLNQSGLPSHGDNFRMLTQEEADKLSEQLLQNPWLNGPIQ